MNQEFLWTEKYRPRRVSDTILPAKLKATFQKFVDDKVVPNLLLCGKPGVGKTTVAMAMLEELQADYIVINGSLSGNIDTLRTDIKNFASSVSISGGRKYVILDEADYLNANSTQPALRNFMEEFSRNCGFILTCNYPARILKELHSRCSVISFEVTKEEKHRLSVDLYKRALEVLEKEEVECDRDALASLVHKHFPDMRRVLNELQRYAATGKIDKGILVELDKEHLGKLLEFMKKKEFTNVRKWVAENSDVDMATLGRRLFDSASSTFSSGSIPALVLVLAKYQYQAAFVADQEINIVACLAEIMVECEFK